MSTTRRIPGYIPTIELFGDWEKTKSLIDGLPVTIKLGSLAGQNSAAQKFLTILRRNIRENGGSIGWPPLSEKYKAWRERNGFSSDNMFVLTGLYYRSINIWNNGNTVYVGMKNNTRNMRTGGKLTLVEIATVLEYGSTLRKIKARPLWGPSFKQLGGSARIKGLIIWHIRNQIFKRHGVRAKVTI